MRSVCSVLSGKLIKLGELRQVLSSFFSCFFLNKNFKVVSALQQCEELLGDSLPSPGVSSIGEFERAVKRETSAVVSFCGNQRFETFDFGRFGSALILCASVVRNNVAIVADGSAASIVRITSTMIGSGQKVVRVLETTATSDPTSDVFHMAQVSITEELRTVNLLAAKLEEMVGEISLQHVPSNTKSPSPPTQARSSSSSSSPPSGGSASGSANSSPGGSPVSRHQARQTLLIGKGVDLFFLFFCFASVFEFFFFFFFFFFSFFLTLVSKSSECGCV
jgi:hypothetical protein